METEFPGNSHKQKAKDSKPEPKKLEKVVTGEVVRRKKPWPKRLVENMIGGDIKTVVPTIWSELLIPAAQDAVVDAGQEALYRVIHGGESRPAASRHASPFGGTFKNYGRYSTSATKKPGHLRDPREREEAAGRRVKSPHNFDEWVLDSRAEAKGVIDGLFNLILEYDAASVANLYELLGVDSNFTDFKWGWTDLSNARVIHVRNGYVLDLPRPEPLD